MADIDLKTATPDTSLPTDGFLFGADSQAASAPSVFTTQSVATTLLGSTSLTGATVTTSQPVLNLSQTWNASGVTFTGLRFNATDTASAAASNLLDLGTGGGTYVSRFSVSKAGVLAATGIAPVTGSTMSLAANLAFTGASNLGFDFNIYTGATSIASARALMGSGFQAGSDRSYSFSSTTAANGTQDLFLTRRAAANLRFGAADAAAPVAQTLSVQSVVAGTSNTAGANLTITGSQGTGSGVGGSIIFETAVANSGGGATVQNTLATAMVIDSVKTVRLGTGYTVATLPAAGTAGRRTYVTDATLPTFLGTLTGGGAVVCPVFDNGTAWVSA